MNANSFWGTIDQLLGREAQKQSGQDSLKVAGWLSAYAGVRKSGGQGDDANGYGNDGYNGLSGRTSSLPSIFPSGNQLLPTDQDGFSGDPRDGQLGTGGAADDGGHHGGARKKVRFRKSKLRQLYDVEVLPVEYMGPKIEYSVNLPRVTAQLEKLMGTNVVRLTDRKYMQELQRRIQEDYNVTLEKRISEREHREWQRQKQLILDGKYSLENCPRALIPLHSIVLAKEIERERNLILSGAGDSIPEEMTSSVFLVNQKTNVNILNKREKLKTIREKNAERLIKQGHRWERERLQMEEQSREREIERRTKREALLEQEKLYMIEENDRSLNLLRVKTKKGPCRDMNLRSVLMQQREELGRSIQRRDFDLKDDPKVDVDGGGGLGRTDRRRGRRGHRKQHQMQRQHEVSEYQESSSPEEGYISMANADSPDGLETSIAIKVAKGASRDSGDESEGEQEDSDNGGGANEAEKQTLQLVPEPVEAEDDATSEGGDPEENPEPDPEQLEATEEELEAAEEARLREELDKKKKARQVRNEDPKITKLKEADTVADIYNVADEIIVLEKKKAKKGFGK
ncbi:capping protein-inhibiting regulator of actin dynamics [Anopheles ziemanni]|uniref:capping protein-inhibiting regulator of actin dynamics n=1 Tax=Anopheles coustani TaxID=139045 RepID=UPI002657D83B|nr:capping protein-inhibiting regulator of actin dynamics [Anopheles coustani]XP_058167052.1 capping protein-inhibiting regulator of actin dynamics [Anopheles ziemanni]